MLTRRLCGQLASFPLVRFGALDGAERPARAPRKQSFSHSPELAHAARSPGHERRASHRVRLAVFPLPPRDASDGERSSRADGPLRRVRDGGRGAEARHVVGHGEPRRRRVRRGAGDVHSEYVSFTVARARPRRLPSPPPSRTHPFFCRLSAASASGSVAPPEDVRAAVHAVHAVVPTRSTIEAFDAAQNALDFLR